MNISIQIGGIRCNGEEKRKCTKDDETRFRLIARAKDMEIKNPDERFSE